MAEAGVQSIKNILRKSHHSGADLEIMPYEWRNVPRMNGFSPAQLMFRRHQRSSLPILKSQNTPIDILQADVSQDKAHSDSKLLQDLHKHSLPLLVPGQNVLLQNPKISQWDSRGIVVSMRPGKLSYIINVENWFLTWPSSSLSPSSPDVVILEAATNDNHKLGIWNSSK